MVRITISEIITISSKSCVDNTQWYYIKSISRFNSLLIIWKSLAIILFVMDFVFFYILLITLKPLSVCQLQFNQLSLSNFDFSLFWFLNYARRSHDIFKIMLTISWLNYPYDFELRENIEWLHAIIAYKLSPSDEESSPNVLEDTDKRIWTCIKIVIYSFRIVIYS